MKKLLGVILLMTILYASKAQDLLSKGTIIPIKIISSINSDDENLPGVIGVVLTDVKDKNGKIVINSNTSVQFSVEKQKAKAIGQAGTIKLIAISVQSTSGDEIIISGSHFVEGNKSDVLAYSLAGGGCAAIGCIGWFVAWPAMVVAPFSALFLLIKGTEATIQEGVILTNIMTLNDYSLK